MCSFYQSCQWITSNISCILYNNLYLILAPVPLGLGHESLSYPWLVTRNTKIRKFIPPVLVGFTVPGSTLPGRSASLSGPPTSCSWLSHELAHGWKRVLWLRAKRWNAILIRFPPCVKTFNVNLKTRAARWGLFSVPEPEVWDFNVVVVAFFFFKLILFFLEHFGSV